MEHSSQAAKNRSDALAAVAAVAASLFVAVGGYVITEHGRRLDGKDLRITALEIQFAAAREHIAEHDSSAAHWIGVIGELQRQERDTKIRLSKLETKPSARPDPFTGSDGKKLEGMINELRRQVYAPVRRETGQ